MSKIKISFMFKKANSSKGGLDDRLVAWWTKGPYSHVEIAYKDENGKDKMCSAVANGKFLNGEVRCKRHLYNEEVYDYLDLYITSKEFKIIMGFLKSIEGSNYDRLGLLGFVLPTQDRANKWFCSEVTSNCLKIIGFEPMWTLDPSNVSPNKFYKLVKNYLDNLSENK